jgi:hypothetical protein
MEMAQDEDSRLLGRKAPDLADHLAVEDPLGRIGFNRPAEAPDQLADLAQASLAHEGEGGVQGDPMDPGLGRGVGLPPRPSAEGLQKGVLCAVLRARRITQHGGKRVENPRIRLLVELVEVFLGPRLVFHALKGLTFGQLNPVPLTVARDFITLPARPRG